MNKFFLVPCLCLAVYLASCGGEQPPTTVHVEYVVSYQGSTTSVVFDGEAPRPVDGSCRIGDSGDPTYPLLLNFRFSRVGSTVADKREIQLYGLKFRAALSPEILPCDGVHINHGGVEEQSLVGCGDAATGPLCAFTNVSYSEERAVVSGSFSCGEFPTNQISGGTPVPMAIVSGNFSLTSCQR